MHGLYVALLSQSNANDPVPTILHNTLHGEIVWTRNGAGDYYGTLEGAFNERTGVIIGGSSNGAAVINGAYANNDIIALTSMEGGEPSDGSIWRMLIEIRVYPA